VNWVFYLGVTATNVAIESTAYPFLLQRRTKTFCAQPLKGTVGNGGVLLVKFETSTGNILINKVYIADSGIPIATA